MVGLGPAGIASEYRGSLPTTVTAAYSAAHGGTSAATEVMAAASAGLSDLSAQLRGFLDAIDIEVRAVGGLSDHIDALVAQLNAVRDEQAKRLVVLDELQGSASDPSLGALLSTAIKARKARVPEVVPERLR